MNEVMKKTLGICVIAVYSHTLLSQVLQVNTSQFYIAPGAHVFVNGGAVFGNSSNLQNDGELTVTKNSAFSFPGNFILESGSAIFGDGTYHVEQDWVNNDGSFDAGAGTVILFGNTLQNISSSTNTSTTFHNLVLTGNGTGNDRKKSLQGADAQIDVTGVLTINDRELATGPYIFRVMNPDAGSVLNNQVPGNEGFVSSVSPGYFSRLTNSTMAYWFPTGSSAGVTRYRPLLIFPHSAGQNGFSARLNNYDANLDDFDRDKVDREICRTNELFYHSVIRNSGTALVDIMFAYIPASDGNWSHVTRWQSTPPKWSMMEPFSSFPVGIFAGVMKSNWNFPNDGNHPYILSKMRPPAPEMNDCPIFCENSTGNVFSATGSSTGYFWTAPANASLTSGQGTDQATIDWTTGDDYVYVSTIGDPGCNSLPDSCMPTVLPVPDASFTTATSNSPFTTFYELANADTLANQWAWDFGDGTSGAGQETVHDFPGTGTYEVMLTVSNEGCSSQIIQEIVIEKFGIYIPNAFTPNGDEHNQVFMPLTNDDFLVDMTIYNRWGEKIFTSDSGFPGWDGTFAGLPCPDGTYTYVVEYINKSTAFREKLTGHVTLLR